MRLIWGLIVFYMLLSSCKSDKPQSPVLQKGEALARQHCSTCHMYPEPELLDSRTWVTSVLPNMGPRMGFDHHDIFEYPALPPQVERITTNLSQSEWEHIVFYYLKASPDRINPDSSALVYPVSRQFSARPFQINFPAASLLEWDESRSHVYLGDALNGLLYRSNSTGDTLNVWSFSSAVTDVESTREGLWVLNSGYLHPNDQPLGKIQLINWQDQPKLVLDSLIRPVSMLVQQNENHTRIFISEYGNNLGQLSAITWQDHQLQDRHVISSLPGNLKVIPLNMITYVTLFGQGREQIGRIEWLPNEQPRYETIREFPPAYGTMDVMVEDMNNNGQKEWITVHGDNYDYSNIYKPYHGVYIYEVYDDTQLKQVCFLPLYGAAQVNAGDLDGDGDLDLIITSNQASSTFRPENGLILARNLGNFEFTLETLPLPIANEWLHVELGDFDGDLDLDILVGALNNAAVVKDQQQMENTETLPAIWLLENQYHPTL